MAFPDFILTVFVGTDIGVGKDKGTIAGIELGSRRCLVASQGALGALYFFLSLNN